MFLLDSNTCVRYLNRRSLAVARRLEATDPSEIAVCSIVKAELFFGAMHSDRQQQTLNAQQRFFDTFISFPFDDLACIPYAEIRADLTKQGTLIGPNDLFIAAIALARNLTRVTHNVREFGRVKGLQLEDWETDVADNPGINGA